jgi:dolichol kinase
LLFDKGLPNSLSRRVPGVLGGFAFLIAVLWLGPWIATALSGGLSLFILVLRLRFRRGLRGVLGSFPTQVWAEVSYPLAGTISLAAGWGLLGDRWLAFVPIAFMAWGDSVAGLTRDFSRRRGTDVKTVPSTAMLASCLAIGVLFQPYWIGALGATFAVAAERFSPRVLSVRDDNWTVVAASLAVMAVLVRTTA